MAAQRQLACPLPEPDKEEAKLDDLLEQNDLSRKPLPKDGACLFRAVSDAVLLTQSQHMHVRHRCVDFLKAHEQEFAPFVCDESEPFDHYLYQMRKPSTWGGQAELQAMSLVYKVNFVIYSLNKDDLLPTNVDNGFKRTVMLCYTNGNHYDIVYERRQMETAKICQNLIYEILAGALSIEPLQPFHGYRNVELESWWEDRETQTVNDLLLANDLGDTSEYEKLSGYYQKHKTDSETFQAVTSRKGKKKGKFQANSLLNFRTDSAIRSNTTNGSTTGSSNFVQSEPPAMSDFPDLPQAVAPRKPLPDLKPTKPSPVVESAVDSGVDSTVEAVSQLSLQATDNGPSVAHPVHDDLTQSLDSASPVVVQKPAWGSQKKDWSSSKADSIQQPVHLQVQGGGGVPITFGSFESQPLPGPLSSTVSNTLTTVPTTVSTAPWSAKVNSLQPVSSSRSTSTVLPNGHGIVNRTTVNATVAPQSAMQSGSVVFFNESKKFGFIRPSDTIGRRTSEPVSDIFLHLSEVEASGIDPRRLISGVKIKFQPIRKKDGKLSATKIVLV